MVNLRVGNRGQMKVVEGGMPSYLLLGAAEEGGDLQLLDDAKSFDEAQQKAEMFLDEHPDGGILITKHCAACYRTPLAKEPTH